MVKPETEKRNARARALGFKNDYERRKATRKSPVITAAAAEKRKAQRRASDQRREDKARRLGFRNRYEMRKAIEIGAFLSFAPERLKRPATIKAQSRFSNPYGYSQNLLRHLGNPNLLRDQKINLAVAWSALKSRSDLTKFNEELALEDEDYLNRYMATFVLGEHGTARTLHGSAQLKAWFVDYLGVYTDTDYDSKYGEI